MQKYSNQRLRALQPNSRMCFVCGLENPVGLKLRIFETAPGQIETRFTAPVHFQGYPGVLHGGIVASILDEICGRAQMGSNPMSPRFMFTAKIQVRYRRNVPVEVPLRILGRAGKAKARSAEAWAGIYIAESDDLLAEADAVLINVPPDSFDASRLGELGWKIYPE
jgi:acyl-coenzyme A thioesterase PaaI-like protein